MSLIAAIQMCSSDKVSDNLDTTSRLIEEAVTQGAKLIVLPEMFAIMGKKDTDKLAAKEIFGKGPIQDFLSRTARTQSVWIVGGTIPIQAEDSHKVRAACIVYATIDLNLLHERRRQIPSIKNQRKDLC